MFALNCVLCDAVDGLSLDDVFAPLVAFVEKKNRREVSRVQVDKNPLGDYCMCG
ncbi:Hypothetical protein, putative [Bodo saltans]|uniref:Uncharacterized protein n=1 Tax=Bodo saltans TaxID=75058 RepID=A0A0S4IXI9_BODSA|nr:Hypothetical protein, putative [Bodo saltans]|eukprot:CUF91517.1 Hypothetical protein, putative [Bodo saltans]